MACMQQQYWVKMLPSPLLVPPLSLLYMQNSSTNFPLNNPACISLLIFLLNTRYTFDGNRSSPASPLSSPMRNQRCPLLFTPRTGEASSLCSSSSPWLLPPHSLSLPLLFLYVSTREGASSSPPFSSISPGRPCSSSSFLSTKTGRPRCEEPVLPQQS